MEGILRGYPSADINVRCGYLIAVRPDLKPKWAASFRDRLSDACGARSRSLPTIRRGGTPPAWARISASSRRRTNQPPSLEISDVLTSSPTAMPDGNIFYGAISLYNTDAGICSRSGLAVTSSPLTTPDGTSRRRSFLDGTVVNTSSSTTTITTPHSAHRTRACPSSDRLRTGGSSRPSVRRQLDANLVRVEVPEDKYGSLSPPSR